MLQRTSAYYSSCMFLGRLKRAVAFCLIMSLPATAEESVLGSLRDGAVHHETNAIAAAHQLQGPQSGHGQEDRMPAHEHGTASDHCTHAHSVSPAISLGDRLPPVPASLMLVPNGSKLPTNRSLAAVFHPPRA